MSAILATISPDGMERTVYRDGQKYTSWTALGQARYELRWHINNCRTMRTLTARPRFGWISGNWDQPIGSNERAAAVELRYWLERYRSLRATGKHEGTLAKDRLWAKVRLERYKVAA